MSNESYLFSLGQSTLYNRPIQMLFLQDAKSFMLVLIIKLWMCVFKGWIVCEAYINNLVLNPLATPISKKGLAKI